MKLFVFKQLSCRLLDSFDLSLGAGPRRPGQGTEEEEQGIVSAEMTGDG